MSRRSIIDNCRGFLCDIISLLEALEEIQAEAQSSLPVDGLYANELHFYKAKVRRIEALATRGLDRLGGQDESAK